MKTRTDAKRWLPPTLALVLLVACGGKTPGNYGDYEEEQVTVIGSSDTSDTAGDERITVSGPTGDGDCVPVSDSLCVPADEQGEWCERQGGPVDIIIADGQVVDVICYPPSEDPDRPVEHVDSTTEGDIDVVQNANRTTVVFNEDVNGVPIASDINVDGNNVAIYGNGADNTIIDGDVTLDGNNVRLRGLTITGNLFISKNNAAVVLCKILGDVDIHTVSTNGTVFAENDVFGSFASDSNNNTITGNDVQVNWNVTGNNNTCDANHAFSDDNGDQEVQDSERGDLLACGGP